ncbi:hypothetical protein [Streptomyces sp. NPDC058268]|uniref:hypothetical protein n=1 Tax=Streptomyces sp. NPDC058268 TaxID=3346413 RepID=UPI0036EE8CDB
MPKSARTLIPGSVFKVYDNGPHGLHLTHMNQLNADLLGFISDPVKSEPVKWAKQSAPHRRPALRE